jgi:hypothetical protein
MVPATEKPMTVDLPSGPASARSIAARREPGPRLLRFVTMTDRGETEVTATVPGAWAAAAPVEMARTVDVHAAMQAPQVIRNRVLDAWGTSKDGPRRASFTCVG